MSNPDAKNAPPPPPNLRMSDDESRECDSCQHHDPKAGNCMAYSYRNLDGRFEKLPVDDEWVCDNYKPGDDSAEQGEYKGKNLKAANAEALRRVRAAKTSDDDGDE